MSAGPAPPDGLGSPHRASPGGVPSLGSERKPTSQRSAMWLPPGVTRSTVGWRVEAGRPAVRRPRPAAGGGSQQQPGGRHWLGACARAAGGSWGTSGFARATGSGVWDLTLVAVWGHNAQEHGGLWSHSKLALNPVWTWAPASVSPRKMGAMVGGPWPGHSGTACAKR